MPKTEPTDAPVPIDHGQRVAGETHFESTPGKVDSIRFTHPAEGPLPPDEQSAAAEAGAIPPADSNAVSTHEITPSASVWEAREDDHGDK